HVSKWVCGIRVTDNTIGAQSERREMPSRRGFCLGVKRTRPLSSLSPSSISQWVIRPRHGSLWQNFFLYAFSQGAHRKRARNRPPFDCRPGRRISGEVLSANTGANLSTFFPFVPLFAFSRQSGRAFLIFLVNFFLSD